MRKRIAIFSNDDLIWSLPTWIRTIPELEKNYDVIGIFLFPELMGMNKGLNIPFWYLKTFGLYNFLLLTLFAIKRKISLLFSRIKNWEDLSIKFKIEFHYGGSPNDRKVYDWIIDHEIDIIFIMVNHILKSEIINAPKIGILNKHAALLPNCRGVFPFFWAKIHDYPTGITFHKVDFEIDSGKILVQMKYPHNDKGISMLRFYIDVFTMYPYLASIAANRLENGEVNPVSLSLESTYFSFPSRSDYKIFKNKSFKIAIFRDLFYKPKFDQDYVRENIL